MESSGIAKKSINWATASLFGAIIALLILFFHSKFLAYLGDPDRLYHFAISRMLAESGQIFLKVLPQLPELGWHEYFPDKEFLFHLVTSIGYRISGESGVVYSVLLFTVLACLGLYAFSLTLFSPWLAFLVTFVGLFPGHYLTRMFAVRPHVLAIFFFLLLNFGLLKRRSTLTAIACGLFLLSYHAFIVPIACLSLALAANLTFDRGRLRAHFELFGAGLIGCVFGIVLNPYFPSNLVLGFQHAMIPHLLETTLSGVRFGNELYPISTKEMLESFWPQVLVVLVGLVVFGRSASITNFNEKRSSYVYLLMLCLFCLWMSSQTYRGTEYLVPSAALLLVASLYFWPFADWLKFGFLGVLFAGQVFSLAQTYQRAGIIPRHDRLQSVSAALALLPENSTATIYNCDWDLGAAILYYRPKMKFIDLLDPSYLLSRSNEIFYMHEDFGNGLVGDPSGLVRDIFNADYVLCERSEAAKQLASDPSFQQLYPRTSDFEGSFLPSVTLFQVQKAQQPEFVREFQMEEIDLPTLSSARAFSPRKNTKLKERKKLELGVYLQLASFFSSDLAKQAPRQLSCVLVQPVEEELTRMLGADVLAIGGGQVMRVWRNQKLIFSSGSSYEKSRVVQALVPLSGGTVKRTDQFQTLVCSVSGAKFFGFTLSFWNRTRIAEVCKWKTAYVGNPASFAPGSDWLTTTGETCIGPMAQEAVPESLRPARY